MIVGLGLFVFPHISLFQLPGFSPEVVTHSVFKKLALFVLFLPNLLLAFNQVIPGATQTWSIGTEEQFYLFWPWIFRSKMNKYKAMAAVIALYLAIKFFLPHLHSSYTYVLVEFWNLFAIDLMAIGGLLALFYFNKDKILNVLYNKWVQCANLALLATGMFFPLPNEVFGIFFGILILNLATNPNRLFSIEWKPLNYLGKISYGLYMYHGAVIIAVVSLAKKWAYSTNLTIYLSVILLTIGVASLSYHFLESPFIKLKSRFTVKPKVKSYVEV